MNRQEILQTLDIPSITDFARLHAVCHDPESLEHVLSLAIGQGELKGRADAANSYNESIRRYYELVSRQGNGGKKILENRSLL